MHGCTLSLNESLIKYGYISPEMLKNRDPGLWGRYCSCSTKEELKTSVSLPTDEFATPCSTPDDLETMSPVDGRKDSQGRKPSLSELNTQLSETLLHDRMYDKWVPGRWGYVSFMVKETDQGLNRTVRVKVYNMLSCKDNRWQRQTLSILPSYTYHSHPHSFLSHF